MIAEVSLGSERVSVITEGIAVGAMRFGGMVSHTESEIPTFIPADQVYYWSSAWQESERKALADIAAGRTRTFADPTDAVRYLLSTDE